MSNYIMLTDAERDRFAVWCRQHAESNRAICEQMEKLGIPGAVAQHQRSMADAFDVVAARLENTEQFTVGGKEGEE